MRIFFTALALSFLLVSCADASVRHYKLEVVAEYPHDTESYTQGLFFHKGQMYETTGLHGKSTLRMVDLTTGEALMRKDFDKKYFLEGSVVFKDNLYNWICKSNKKRCYKTNYKKRPTKRTSCCFTESVIISACTLP